MTVALFVLMLTIPVVILARRTPFNAAVIGLWGFFLGLTPIGPQIAHALDAAGAGIADLL